MKEKGKTIFNIEKGFCQNCENREVFLTLIRQSFIQVWKWEEEKQNNETIFLQKYDKINNTIVFLQLSHLEVTKFKSMI